MHSTTSFPAFADPAHQRAIVIGGRMAGLAVARVQQMIAPPTLFFRPDVLLRVLAASRRRRQSLAPAVDAGQPETAIGGD